MIATTLEQLRTHTVVSVCAESLSVSCTGRILFSFLFGMLRKPSVALMKQKEGDTGHRQLGFLSEVGLSLPGERGGLIPFLEGDGDGCPSVRRGV